MSTRVLCNFPLESFVRRERMGAVELLTFGPPGGREVAGATWPFDVDFDPSTGSVHELLAALPAGFAPDLVLLWWADQQPLPDRIEECPVPVVGVISDYNLSLPWITGLWPFFDVMLVDRPGVGLFDRMSFPDVRQWHQFSFKEHVHRCYAGVERNLDVVFAGNLNPAVQGERMPWLERLAGLRTHGVSVEIASGLDGPAYGLLMNRAKIGFNRSIRGEMNLRAYEVPACGAALLMERENREVGDILEPGREVALYGDDDFEDVVLDLLLDEDRREGMARAGHERIQDHHMGRQLERMLERLGEEGPGRAAARASPFELLYGRAQAMFGTGVHGPAQVEPLVRAAHLAPDDPRPVNALALAILRWRGEAALPQAADLLQKACALCPRHLPAAFNLAWLTTAAGHPELTGPLHSSVEERAGNLADWRDVDGAVLPLGFSENALHWAHTLHDAIAANDLQHMTTWKNGVVPLFST